MKRLTKVIAIVPGESGGLGGAIVEGFVVQGVHVMTCDIERETGERVVEEINHRYREYGRVFFIHADVGDRECLRQLVELMVEQFGTPSVLINNVTVVIFRTSFRSFRREIWGEHASQRAGLWWLSRLVYPYMSTYGRGSIINVASTYPYQTKPGAFPHNVTKGAILAMNKALSVDFGASGVRVNALLPGIVNTKPTQEWLAGFADQEAKR